MQNEGLFAVAQKKYVHLYDGQGTEVQVLKEHVQPTHLNYLPYHFLLVSVVSRTACFDWRAQWQQVGVMASLPI